VDCIESFFSVIIYFDMADLVDIVHFIQISIILFAILLALIYSVPILLIHRFHHSNNTFTVNLCLVAICCNTYWALYYMILKLHPQYLLITNICSILNYFEMMCTFQVLLALIAVSINRLCLIVYHTKVFFKKKRWIILSIAIQWIIGIVFSLPVIPFNSSVRNFFYIPV
jgi:hypothetical protein